MLHWIRKKLKPVARGTLAMVASLWFVAAAAPCVMAQPQHMDQASVHCPDHEGMVASDMNDCGPVTALNCTLPDTASPIAAALDQVAATPVLLTLLPVSTYLPPSAQHPRYDFFSPDIPTPPLRIRYLTLLI